METLLLIISLTGIPTHDVCQKNVTFLWPHQNGCTQSHRERGEKGKAKENKQNVKSNNKPV